MKHIESFPGRIRETLCFRQLEELQRLTDAFQIIDLPRNSKEATTSVLRSQLDESLSSSGWESGYLIDNQISIEYPTANYTLDLSLDSSAEICGHKHRYVLEFCFDNRQAIGTNLLKYEVACANTITQGWEPLPFLVCATSQVIKQFGWDGGVASYQEYDHAIRIPYKGILKNPPVLIALSL